MHKGGSTVLRQSNSALGHLGGGEQVIDQGVEVEADRLGDLEQFDDVHAATAGLDLRHDGLVAAEALGQLSLAQARALALLDQSIDEPNLSM